MRINEVNSELNSLRCSLLLVWDESSGGLTHVRFPTTTLNRCTVNMCAIADPPNPSHYVPHPKRITRMLLSWLPPGNACCGTTQPAQTKVVVGQYIVGNKRNKQEREFNWAIMDQIE